MLSGLQRPGAQPKCKVGAREYLLSWDDATDQLGGGFVVNPDGTVDIDPAQRIIWPISEAPANDFVDNMAGTTWVQTVKPQYDDSVTIDAAASVIDSGFAQVRIYQKGTSGGTFVLQIVSATASEVVLPYSAGDELRFTVSVFADWSNWQLKAKNVTTGTVVTGAVWVPVRQPVSNANLVIGNYVVSSYCFPGNYTLPYRI